MTRLAICPECSRHVRATEASCPFCSVALAAGSLSPRSAAATRGLKRAALFALSAVAASACGEEDKDNGNAMQPSMTGTASMTASSTATNTSEPSAQPVYGAPVGVGGMGNVGMGGANDPGPGNPVAVYGAPPASLDEE